jgi:Tfp pilus assembly PilM family ATPase
MPGKFKARRPGHITALDLDGNVLRVVQATPRGSRTAITRIASAQLEIENGKRSDAAALGAAIAKALHDLRIKPGPVVMGMPRNLVILRTLLLPAIADLREMASMVHLQIAKDLPFRLEEAVIDFKVRRQTSSRSEASDAASANISNDSASRQEVLVASVRRDAVIFYQQVAEAAKLRLVALGWLSQAHARCIEACGISNQTDSVALVSLRSDEVGIDILAQQSLLFSRGASIKVNADETQPGPITDPSPQPATLHHAAYIDSVRIEVVRTLHSYNGSESVAPVTLIVVAGATGQENAVLNALQARLNISCSLLDPEKIQDLPSEARELVPGSLAALGLALESTDPRGLPFDFLNPKRPAVQRNMRRIRILAAATAGTVLLVSLLGARSYLINQREKILRQVQAEVQAAEKQRPIYQQMQRQSATIQNWLGESRNWLEHYSYLSAILPPCEDIYITSLSISSQGNIHLAVQARSGEILATMDKQLRTAGYQVKPLAIHPGNDKFGYPFRSTVELIVPPKFQIDISKLKTPARPEDDSFPGSSRQQPRKGGRS